RYSDELMMKRGNCHRVRQHPETRFVQKTAIDLDGPPGLSHFSVVFTKNHLVRVTHTGREIVMIRAGLLAFAVLGGIASVSTPASANFDGTYDIHPLNFTPMVPCTDCGDVTISGDGTTSITIDILVTG